MTMVDWLLIEQFVEIFREARAQRPELVRELNERRGQDEEAWQQWPLERSN